MKTAERSSLIKLAASLPKGSEERQAIHSGLHSAGTVKEGGFPLKRVRITFYGDESKDEYRKTVSASSWAEAGAKADQITKRGNTILSIQNDT